MLIILYDTVYFIGLLVYNSEYYNYVVFVKRTCFPVLFSCAGLVLNAINNKPIIIK